MSAVRYPIAVNAARALGAPVGRASRASEAALIASASVTFVSEVVGPAFATREAALDAFPGRLDDERPGRGVNIQSEDRYCSLRELESKPAPGRRRPVRPVYAEGRRWPPPPPPPRTVWRLSISYWRVNAADGSGVFEAPSAQASLAPPRRRLPADADADALRQRLESPMTAAKPQKALDVGLFEVRPPEAPHILMPDE